MSSFRSRARRIAFGDSNEHLPTHKNDNGESRTSRSSSHSSTFSRFSNHHVFHHTSSMSTSDPHPSDKPVHLPPKRTNRVRRIHRSQPFELFVEALEQDGCVVIQDFVNPQIPAQVESAEHGGAESASDADSDSDHEENRGREAPLDLNALIRESLLTDTLYQILSTHFLTMETLSWRSKSAHMSATKPTLFSSTTTDLNTTSHHATTFHRADHPLHTHHAPSQTYSYQSHRDTMLGLLVPELDSLSATIPVRVIPGSHLWDDQKPDTTRGVKEVHLSAGEAMILLGSLYYAVGEDEAVDRHDERPPVSRASGGSAGSCKERLLHDLWMCSGVYRPRDQIVLDEGDEDA